MSKMSLKNYTCNRNDYSWKQNEFSNFKPDQTVIIKKRFLKYLPGIQTETVSSDDLPYDEWYAYVNSYYPFTEDVDAFARVNHLLECNSSESLGSKDDRYKFKQNVYSSKIAQHQYLESKPISFFILGKPGLDEEAVGKRLADYWKCVYIDPLVLLEEEIFSGSRAGQCIEFNLRCGRAIDIDVIIRLLARKIQSPSVKHRGFVLSGFPLIPNDLYEEDPISSESAVFNVTEIFEEIFEQTINIIDDSAKVEVSMIGSSSAPSENTEVTQKSIAESPDPSGELQPKISFESSFGSVVCGPKEIITDLEKQVNCLFGLFSDPFIIIYLNCRNLDVISKRDNYYFDIYSKKTLDMQKIRLFYESGNGNEFLVQDLFNAGDNPFVDNPELKHIVKVPENLPANVGTQLDRYHRRIANLLDCKILTHDQQYYIKLDGRAFITQMMDLIKLRLKVLPLQLVILPQRFHVSLEEVGEGAKPQEDEEMSVDEALQKFSKKQTVAPQFKWLLSDWGTFCPVSMTRGIYVKGDPKYAVHFMNRIFFLADEDSFIKFHKNPRPYLLPPYPKPGSKVFVFGPPVSGKTAVSKCLGYMVNSKVLTPGEMHQDYLEQLKNEYKEKVKQGAIAEGLELLKEQKLDEYNKKVEEQKTKIEEWKQSSINFIQELNDALGGTKELNYSELSSFPLRIDLAGSLGALKKAGLPPINDIETCQKFLNNPELLDEFIPEDLKKEIVQESPSVLDPFILQYVDEKVQNINDNEIIKGASLQNFTEIYSRGMKTFDEQNDYDGWIIDGMPTNVDLIKQVYEEFSVDEIILLYCSDNDFLKERLQRLAHPTEFTNFKEFFLSIDAEEEAYRCPSSSATDLSKEHLTTDVVHDVLKLETINEELLKQYEQSLDAYNDELKNVEDFFNKLGIDCIKIDVAQLSMKKLLNEVYNKVKDKYRETASEFTDEDRAEEVQMFLAQKVDGGEGESDNKEVDTFAKNRRYGDSSYYCPVSFATNFVLWRGKEEFAAKFQDKVYLMATKENMEDFIKSPRQYLLRTIPPERFPPPRICVVGAPESGKTAISKLLAKNLGVQHLDFTLMEFAAITAFSNTSLYVDFSNLDNVPETLRFEWYDTLIRRMWFKEPLKYGGFVFDNWPQRPRDLDYLLQWKCPPDILICVRMNREESVKRLVEKSLDNWKEKLEETRNINEMKHTEILKEWEEKRKKRYDEIIESERAKRYKEKIGEKLAEEKEIPPIPEEGNQLEFTSETQISVDSVADMEEQKEAMKILDEEFPKPTFDKFEEEEEAAMERLTVDMENLFDSFSEYLEEMKQICDRELIPWFEVDGTQQLDKIIKEVYVATDPIKFRNRSFFERCYDIPLDVADKLLAQGYYFLSFFGRLCPVQYYDKLNPLYTYRASEEKNNLYPVIHRQYIYFIDGKKNWERFTKNPLKFTNIKKFLFNLIPMRVAIIGPPKCGKTTLAQRFRRDLAFRVVSRGQAIRYTLQNLPFSNLAQSVEKILRKGDELPDEIVMECVNAASFCGESLTEGLVFDGFPNSIQEVTFLSRLGLVPHLICDLEISDDELYKFAAVTSYKNPSYSHRFIKHLVRQWRRTQNEFRVWCDREYQNIYKICVDRCIWGVWDIAKEITWAVGYERKHYYGHVKFDWPLRLSYMLVTPLEYLERQSGYKSYCPVCLFHTRSLKNGGEPPDRAGLVHFRRFFYWLCEEHIEEFLKIPEKFIPPSNISLPQNLPSVLHLTEYPSMVVEDGYCLVCYLNNMPKRTLVKGDYEYAVSYRDETYLFDCEHCLSAFMTQPQKMSEVTINFKLNVEYPSLDYSDLPVLGMLEQYVGRRIVKAINHVNIHRPIIPGLSISTSALVCIGLNLKVYNANLSKQHLVLYEKALKKFHQRRLDLIRYLDLMKKYRNPFVHYEEPSPPLSLDSLSLSNDEDNDGDGSGGDDVFENEITSVSHRVPVPDERFDYLCEYFKPLSKVPAFLNVVDIAGLVKGASEGQGLGNAFLSHISACDAIFHLCRAFEDDDVTHVEGDIDPVRDLDIIAEELRLKDEETLMKNMEKLERTVLRGGDKKLKPEYDTLVKIKTVLVDEKKHIRFGDWDLKDIEILNKYLFLTSKPTLYLVNLSEKDYIKKKNKWLIKIKEWVDKNDPGALIIPFSGRFEHKLVEEYEDPALRKKFLEEMNTTSALDKIIVQGYKALQLEYFFTAGPDEVKAWTIQKGTKAPQAAGRIHTDFEKGFIMAEVMKFNDFKEEGSEAACKAAGKYRQQGRNYVVEDGDIIFFKFNAGAGLKDAKKK